MKICGGFGGVRSPSEEVYDEHDVDQVLALCERLNMAKACDSTALRF